MTEVLCGALVILAGLAPTQKNDSRELRALLNRAIEAHGGARKLEQYQAARLKTRGHIRLQGQTFDFTGSCAVQLPDRLRSEVVIDTMGQKYRWVEVLNRGQGWRLAAGVVSEMPREMLVEAREEMHTAWVLGQLTPIRGKKYRLEALGETTVDGRTAVGLRVRRRGYRDASLFFDSKTGLLIKLETRVKDQQAGGREVVQEILYGDYRKVKGLQVAHSMTIRRDGKDFLTSQVTCIHLLEHLDSNLFARPQASD
jgi:hypothetical protein